MKVLILFSLLVQNSLASTLPLSWVDETNANASKNDDTILLKESGSYLNEILASQEKVLTNREDKNINGFKFSHYVTDFSVSKSGLFGLSAFNAKSALEIKWKNKMAVEDETQSLEFIDDSPSSLKLMAAKIKDLAMKSGKVRYNKYLRKNIEFELLRIQILMEQLQEMECYNWKLKGLRLDINIGADGKVWIFAKAGANVRIRLDWKKLNKSNPNKVSQETTCSKTSLVTKILYDLNQIYSKEQFPDFKVKRINIGVGLSNKTGFLGIGSSKQSFVGYLRFEPVKEKMNQIVSLNHSMAMEDIESLNEEEGIKLPRKKWKNALIKSIDITKFFAQRANRTKKSWYIEELKTIFDLTKTGFLGLSSLSSMAIIETELVRK